MTALGTRPPRSVRVASALKQTAGRRPMPTKKGATGEQKQGAFPAISRKSGLEPLELRGREVIEVPGVLTPGECEAFIRAAEGLGFQHQGSRGPAFGEAYRDNGRTAVNSAELAGRLWRDTGLQEVCRAYPVDGRSAVGLNPNIRFYKYEAGNRFGKHIDESVRVGVHETRYTLLIYLSGGKGSSRPQLPGVTGGETLFYGGKRGRLVASVAPAPGLALLHLHGDECLEHEGAEVLGGTKFVLRSDVVYA